MATKNRSLLNKNYQEYYSDSNLKYKNFVLDGHPSNLKALAEFLEQHEIQSYSLEKKSSVKGYDYQKQKTTTTSFSENAIVVPSQQVKGKMAQVLLEPQTKLSDS